MGINKISTTQFLELAQTLPVLDVRSPAEYAHAHIPGAYSFPLFNDEERKQVGTAYKQQSREQALKLVLDYFGPNMRKMVEDAESIAAKHSNTNTLLVHCWRGGMRSAAITWLLNLYGFKIYTLSGGYKSFRNWVLQQFTIPYPFHILGGYTGSAKTLLLQELKKKGENIIDLEALAMHKGSAFGANPNLPQPTQEMFENLLAFNLFDAAKNNKPIWLEDESQRIGNINLPGTLWSTMRAANLWFINIPFQHRLNYITDDYGKLTPNQIVEAIMRIKSKLGGLNTKNAINYVLENNTKACFSILLEYYDKAYHKSLYNRTAAVNLVHDVPCNDVNPKNNYIHLKNALSSILQ